MESFLGVKMFFLRFSTFFERKKILIWNSQLFLSRKNIFYGLPAFLFSKKNVVLPEKKLFPPKKRKSRLF